MAPTRDRDDLFGNEDMLQEYCPHCGKYSGGDSICPNCGNEVFNDSGLEEQDEDMGEGSDNDS